MEAAEKAAHGSRLGDRVTPDISNSFRGTDHHQLLPLIPPTPNSKNNNNSSLQDRVLSMNLKALNRLSTNVKT
jgi:hypothetical protein